MSSPFFSILIPVYNGSKTLTGVLDSIKDQSYKNFEILIYDDCSTDRSKLIIEGWIKKQNIKVIFKSGKINRGSYYGLQNCFDLSSGDYLICSAQDNFFMPNRLKLLAQAIQKKPNLKMISSDVFVGNYSQYLAGIALIQKGLASFISLNLFRLLMFRSLMFRFDTITLSRDNFKYFPASHKYSPSEDFVFIVNVFANLVSQKKDFLHIKSPLVYIIFSNSSQSHINSYEISQSTLTYLKQLNFSPFYQNILYGNVKLIALIRLRSFKKLLNFLLFNPIQSFVGILVLGIRVIIMLLLRSNGNKALNKITSNKL